MGFALKQGHYEATATGLGALNGDLTVAVKPKRNWAMGYRRTPAAPGPILPRFAQIAT